MSEPGGHIRGKRRGFGLWGRVCAGLAALFAASACASAPQLRHPQFGTDCADLAFANDASEGYAIPVECVTVHYGTNRAVRTASELGASGEQDTVEVRADDAGTLTLGRADVWLPALKVEGGTRERGETPELRGDLPEDERELARYVFLTRITAAGRERFSATLQDAVDWDGDGSLLLFVHGFNVEFEPALIRAAQLSADLSRRGDFNAGAPVLFSWPSNGQMSLASYRSDRDRSAAAAPHLEAFLDLLTEDLDVDRINIIAHSMGNRVLTRGLEQFAADYVAKAGDAAPEFRIIMAAADVDSAIFDQAAGVLDTLDADVTIYTSDNDRALAVSSLINSARRLGTTYGDQPYIRDSVRYQTVDATAVATELFGLGHGYYSKNPFVLGEMLCALSDKNPADRPLRERRFAGQPDGPVFFQADARLPASPECALVRPDGVDPDPKRIETGGMGGPMPPPAPVPSMDGARGIIDVPAPLTLPWQRGSFDADALAARIVAAAGGAEIASVALTVHTDRPGDAAANLAITARHAEALREALVRLGVPRSVITAIGKGESEPAWVLLDGSAEPLNDRVEVELELAAPGG